VRLFLFLSTLFFSWQELEIDLSLIQTDSPLHERVWLVDKWLDRMDSNLRHLLIQQLPSKQPMERATTEPKPNTTTPNLQSSDDLDCSSVVSLPSSASFDVVDMDELHEKPLEMANNAASDKSWHWEDSGSRVQKVNLSGTMQTLRVQHKYCSSRDLTQCKAAKLYTEK
jgi:hypothetical protein